MSVASARSLRTELAVLASIGLHPARRHVVLNLADKASGLSVHDVETTIGVAVDAVIPRSPRVALAMNQGIPLLQDCPKNVAAAGFTKVLRLFADPAPRRSLPHRRKMTRA
jgi:pilus assembly protein CpaE